MSRDLICFKAYDVRGEIGKNFNSEICYRIAYAFSRVLRTKTVIVGWDARKTSPEFASSICSGLEASGNRVLTLGLCGTEELYFAVSYFGTDGGIQITGSHNPINFNGLKMVKSGSAPLNPDTELLEVKLYAEQTDIKADSFKGSTEDIGSISREAYIKKVLSFVDLSISKPLRVVINSGNGAAGPTFDSIIKKLKHKTDKINFLKLHHEPDSSFPNGIPNPMLIENQLDTSSAVIKNRADFGVAFDGDFDRCFFFDERGRFIKGEYIVGLLAAFFLEKEKGGTIVHDSRVIWNLESIIIEKKGNSLISKTGHAYIKKNMRDSGAIYGGELSAHHYFRDFFYCDSGMLPWLLVCELVSLSGKKISHLIKERVNKFPSSGEINFTVSDVKKVFSEISNCYSGIAHQLSTIDGLSFVMGEWRFNLRASGTEPIIRLNIESRGNKRLIKEKIKEISDIIKRFQ